MSSESPKSKHFLCSLSSGRRPFDVGGMTAGPGGHTGKGGPMDFLIRFTAILALGAAATLTAPAAADYEGADGYGGSTEPGFDVSHDGYQREGQTSATPDNTAYVVIEAEDGTTEVVDGDTVIVVQEPEPVAATEQAPPAPKTIVVVQPEVQCPGAIWVDGYWAYSNGDYIWVDGHCVVERVNYVFVQPRWDYYSSVWWFVPGYYRPWGVYVGFGYYRPWQWYPPYHHPYYRTGHPVPVRRTVPRRPTTVHPTRPTRGVVGRPSSAPARTTTVSRRPPTTSGRTGTVSRVGTRPTRTGTVTRAPSTRTGTVTRTRPSATRVDAVNRARNTPARTMVVHRPPATPARTSTVGRSGSGRTLTSSVQRSRPSNTVVSQPRVNPTRTNSVRRPPSTTSSRASVNRPSSSPSRSSAARRPSGGAPRSGSGVGSRPSTNPSRTHSVERPSSGSSRGGSFSRPSSRGSRPSMGSSRPSMGGSRPSMGRGGGLSRPSSGGFGGSRSVPTARGR